MSFSNQIISWFRENGRALPWRETRDPYAIWLSEIILQQTRIVQGLEYWERFMAQYPTVDALAAASEDEVLKLWQGLGYYSRARNLHAAAKQIVEMGKFPDTLEGIKSLKGVGDYTAAAIGSFAFDIPAAVVDGNVYRVLSRYFGIDTPINSTQGKKEFAALAQSLIPGGGNEKIKPEAFEMELSPISAYNQGMMDFGAIQCTPQSPKCLLCPLAETCEALRNDRVAELPVKEKKLKVQTRRLTYIYIRCQEETSANGEQAEPMIAIHRRGKGDIWQGLWEPYNASDSKKTPIEYHEDIEKMFHLPTASLNYGITRIAKDVKHVLTHRILLADFYLLETDGRFPLPADYIWIKESEFDQYGIPRLIEILLEKLRKWESE
jgi:A/G-specific adenine glycosylase|uniref:A/G-specific adenine glycosylase n=1 Tax=Prevotella sp. TaxID=59823 RepID=UPI0025FDE78E|nr:A/G-specific adenine glycosylase [uncultured Prevotella sp.]